MFRHNFYYLILLLTCSLFAAKRHPTEVEIIGTWNPNDGGHSGIFEFNKDGTGAISGLHDSNEGKWSYKNGQIIFTSVMFDDIDTIPVAIDDAKEGILFLYNSAFYSPEKMDSIYTVDQKKRNAHRTKFTEWKELLWTQTMPMSRLDSSYVSGVWYAHVGWADGVDLLILNFTSNEGLEVNSYELDYSESYDIMECIPNSVDKPTLYRYAFKNNQLISISPNDDTLTLYFKKIAAEVFEADVEYYGGTDSDLEFFQLPYCP